MNLDIEKWKLFDFVKIFDIKKGFYNKNPKLQVTGQFLSWVQPTAIMVLPGITPMKK